MKIFCIGLGRTGTTTFGTCMRMLGLNHCTGPVGLGLTLNSLSDYTALQKIIENYDSFSDFPWPLLYKKLSTWHPDAYFILTRRKDVDTWYRSLCKHFDRTGPTEGKKLAYGYYFPRSAPTKIKEQYLIHLTNVRKHFNSNPRF